MDTRPAPAAWLRAATGSIDDLLGLVDERTQLADHPTADRIVDNVVVYDSALVLATAATEAGRLAVQAELADVLLRGPGIVVLERAFADTSVIDRASDVFRTMIDLQHAAGTAAGDHFAKPGANDRVWNALEKLAVLDPATFVDYYANEIVALTCTAWLGPHYQMTSQVNVVNPGGAAQEPHCDYHLGFLADEQAEQFPAHVHQLSPALTLQGAVAHNDMAVESGPTTYLPHSQKYANVYLGWRRDEVRELYMRRHIQLPLAKGDVVFFNPALLHAAGHNRTSDVRRMANLLQVSSAFGRAMEVVDRERMVNAIYPTLMSRRRRRVGLAQLDNAVAAAAEGYAFPTNLDRDQPIGGLAPPSQADLVRRALDEGHAPDRLRADLRDHAERRLTS